MRRPLAALRDLRTRFVLRKDSLLPALLCALAAWLLLSVLAALANQADNVKLGGNATVLMHLRLFAGLMTPTLLLATGLIFHFANRDPAALLSKRTFFQLSGFLLVFQPLNILVQAYWPPLLRGRALPALHEIINFFSASFILVDSLLYLFTCLACLAWGVNRGRRRQQIAQDALTHENLRLRLRLLQGQLEPYFLLASLQGIHEQILYAERAQAIKAISKLSQLLRYVLQSNQEDKHNSVADEIDFLRNCISLHQLRPENAWQVTWDIGEEDWHALHCPPLLLYPALGELLQYAPPAFALRNWRLPAFRLRIARKRSRARIGCCACSKAVPFWPRHEAAGQHIRRRRASAPTYLPARAPRRQSAKKSPAGWWRRSRYV
ncbi:histidine kinase [Massilia sp. W12]|uniref:histidine kinase n=1 Tax=Massilia sp. W12 TaxID=3126507 RepID=UPI0030CAC227